MMVLVSLCQHRALQRYTIITQKIIRTANVERTPVVVAIYNVRQYLLSNIKRKVIALTVMPIISPRNKNLAHCVGSGRTHSG